MSEIQKSKANIENEFRKITETNQIIDKKLDAAKAAGNDGEFQSLINDLRAMKEREYILQGEYSNILEQEKKPELERVQKLGSELRQPLAVPMPNYMGMSGMPGVTALPSDQVSVEDQRKRQREIIAERYNFPQSEGGRESERIPTSLMAQVESLYDPTSKAQLLKNSFPGANIRPVDVGGNTEFIITLPDGSRKTTLDKGVASLAGFAAEIPPTAAEIASFIGILGTTKSPALATVGSSVAGAGVGALMDEGLRYAYNLNPDVGGTLARRGTQAAVGAAIGGFTDVAIPAIRAARIKDPFTNTFAARLDDSARNLMAREEKLAAKQFREAGKIQVPMGARLAGQQGIEAQSELAGAYPKSNIASLARSTQETLVKILDDWKSKVPANPNNYAYIAARKKEQQEALSQQISSSTGRNKRIIEAAIDRQTKGPLSNKDKLGKVLFDSVKSAEDQSIANVKEAYQNVFTLADDGGFSVTPEEMLDVVYQIGRDINKSGSADTSAIKTVTDRLIRRREAPRLLQEANTRVDTLIKNGKQPSQELMKEIADLSSLNKPLNSEDFDSFIKAFREARPDNMSSGANKDVFGREIASKLSDYRIKTYDSIPTVLPDGTATTVGNVFRDASSEVQKRQGYEANLLGNILREAAGEQSSTPRGIVNAIMQEPSQIKKVVQSLKQLGQSDPSKAGEADKVLGMLQLQYMNNIGVGAGGAKSIQADTGMLDALFGANAGAQKRSIDELNRNLGNIKGLDASSLTIDDVKRMGQALTENERKALTKGIVKRIEGEKEEALLIKTKVFKAAEQGDFKNIDADLLSGLILGKDTSIAQVDRIMKQLSKESLESRNLFKGDFKRNLLRDYPGGDATANAPFESLFDTKKFVADYEASGKFKSAFAEKMEVVLGKEEATALYDIAKLYEANTIADTAKVGYSPRMFLSNKGTTLGLPIAQVSEAVKNRFVTAMLSTGNSMPQLKAALARNALPGDINKVYNQMAKDMFLTRTGITALAHQASSDPEFSAELIKMAREYDAKEGLNLEEK